MRFFKILLIAAIAFPGVGQMQAQSRTSSSKTTVSQSASKYPLYSDSEAAVLWAKWKKHETFTDENYARVIDLCDASFTYLSDELSNIINTCPTAKKRQDEALKLDMGITSNMSNFARTFAVRMQNLAADGTLSPENINKVVAMLEKKKTFMAIYQEVYHPQ